MNGTTFIKVQIQFEGTHKWPKAPRAVSHLKNRHRHTFIVTAQIEVYHYDRELEFYMVKDFLNKIRFRRLNNKSCEMINNLIYKRLSKKYGNFRKYIIETSEDGQRGAVSYYNFSIML